MASTTSWKHSNNSAPGPDGVPFGVWRALGMLGAEVLTGVPDLIQREDAVEVFNDAYQDETERDAHNVHLSITCASFARSDGWHDSFCNVVPCLRGCCRCCCCCCCCCCFSPSYVAFPNSDLPLLLLLLLLLLHLEAILFVFCLVDYGMFA